jgi:hypothetical protein
MVAVRFKETLELGLPLPMSFVSDVLPYDSNYQINLLRGAKNDSHGFDMRI